MEYSLRGAAPSEACGATERTLVSTTTESHEYVYASGTNATQTYYYITNIQGDVTHLPVY